MQRPSQISLARLFAVVTLIAVSLGSGAALASPHHPRGLLVAYCVAAMLLCPFIAVGVLVKRPLVGLMLAAIVLLAVTLIAPALQAPR